ncbi:DNA-binding transcriptional regulator, IclR family [Lentzea waywayandensis]|uniref:DNA-binding transcriptional regulator, IclR family n=1 Tax=Lentzea waywayandensis TaxID=84724 RepID=A0A1I6EDI8_9PSEU|nr:IclR family transcriptional regulator [Lentzea waywayandensis]SFR15588.1 DNA-binding transcriptional regulator, IclR family [Lentzea waywayandensis]
MTDTAVEKTLAVLEALADHSRITDIARVTGLPKSTVHRLLQAMVDRGFATISSDGYLAGPRILALAGKVLRPIDTVERARPSLRALQESTGCTVHLAVLFGDELVYVDKIEADKPYRMASRLGMSLPAHGTAIGKAVLASLSTSELDAYLSRTGLPGRTPRTITSSPRLKSQLTRVRRSRFALDDEENEVGVRCVGAAIRDHAGTVIGGLSASTLAMEHSLPELIALGPRVLRAADEVSAALGWL